MAVSATIEAKRARRRRRTLSKSPAERFALGVALRRRSVSMYAAAHGLTHAAALRALRGLPPRSRSLEVTMPKPATALLGVVHERLESKGIRYAVIGATAMGLHGYVRSTVDVDLFTDSLLVLDRRLWFGLPEGVELEVVNALYDDSDPLAGLVRFEVEDTDESVDLVVKRAGRGPRGVVVNAQPMDIGGGLVVPVASPAHLVALKLYAGSPRDLRDVEAMCDEIPDLADQVDAMVASMGESERSLWASRGR